MSLLRFGSSVQRLQFPRRPRLVMLVNESKHFLSHRVDAARAAVRDGFDVHLITRLLHDPAEIQRYGVQVHHMEFPRTLRNPATELRALRNLQRLYRKLQPDILHHFSAKAILVGSLAARGMRARHVVNTFTGLGAAFTGRGPKAALRRIAATGVLKHVLRSSQWRVTFQNHEDMQQLVAAGIVRQTQCQVIAGSGVDPTQFQPTADPGISETPGVPTVMLASRMIWPKGIGQFVEAASLLKQTATHARFVLVGDTDHGSATAVPVEQLEQWDADGVVQWWGHCADMPTTLARASIVVLPTYYGEGLPKVLLEAAASGKPVIATDVRGCREIVHDNDNGLLIPPHDVEALASAMWRLLHQPERRRQMGLRGRELVLSKFTTADVARQTLDVYRRMIGLPSRVPAIAAVA